MIGALLVLGLLAAIAYGATRSVRDRAPGGRVPRGLDEALERWVEAGAIDSSQADRIRSVEVARSQAATGASRVPIVVELFGYLGGVLVLLGAVMLVAQFWDDLSQPLRLAIAAGAAIVPGVVGGFVDESVNAPFARLRGFLWLASGAGAALLAGLFAADTLDLGPPGTAQLVGATLLVHGALLWADRATRPLQQLQAAAGVVVVVVASLSHVEDLTPAVYGFVLWTLGAALGGVSLAGLVRPRPLGLAESCLLLVVGAATVAGDWRGVGLALGLVTAVGLGALAAWTRVPVLAAGGFVAIAMFVPWTAVAYLGDRLGAPVVLALCGVLVLLVAAATARRVGPGGRSASPMAHV